MGASHLDLLQSILNVPSAHIERRSKGSRISWMGLHDKVLIEELFHKHLDSFQHGVLGHEGWVACEASADEVESSLLRPRPGRRDHQFSISVYPVSFLLRGARQRYSTRAQTRSRLSARLCSNHCTQNTGACFDGHAYSFPFLRLPVSKYENLVLHQRPPILAPEPG